MKISFPSLIRGPEMFGFEKAKKEKNFYVLGFPRSGNMWLRKIIQETVGVEYVAGCHPYNRLNHEPLEAKQFIYNKSIFVYRRDYKRVLFSLTKASENYTEKDLSTLLKLYCKMNREYLKSEIFSICKLILILQIYLIYPFLNH